MIQMKYLAGVIVGDCYPGRFFFGFLGLGLFRNSLFRLFRLNPKQTVSIEPKQTEDPPTV
jgi:hypothetical protein